MSQGIHLVQQRINEQEDATISELRHLNNAEVLTFLLEPCVPDYERTGLSRCIPAGVYALKLREFGGFHTNYAKLYPEMHKGMIQICDVPGRTDILFHIGNFSRDTKGCMLTGEGVSIAPGKLRTYGSGNAYKRIYPGIAAGIARGFSTLTVKDVYS
jgi:hypothetical protein